MIRPHASLGPLLRLGSLVAAGNIVTVLFRLVALRIYTHVLSTHAFGTANLVLGILALAAQLGLQPVGATQLRYQPEAARAGSGDAFMVQALRWTLVGSACVSFAVVAGFLLGRPGEDTPIGPALLAGAVFWIFASTTRTAFSARLQAEQRMRLYIWLRVAEAGLIAGLSSLAVIVSPSAEAFVWGQVGALLLSLLITARVAPWPSLSLFARLREPDRASPRFREKLRSYGAAFVPNSALQWLSSMGDRYVLAALLGAGAVGQYLAAFTLASTGFLLLNGMMLELFRPKLFDAESAGQRARANRIFLAWTAAYVAVAVFGLAALALLGDTIVWLLLAAPYRDAAVDIMLWVAAGYSLNGLAIAFENRLLALGRSAALLPPLALGGLLNVALGFVFVPWHGIVGAAEANAAGFLARFVLTAIILAVALRSRKAPA